MGLKEEEEGGEKEDKAPLHAAAILSHLVPITNWRHTTFELLTPAATHGGENTVHRRPKTDAAAAEEKFEPPKSLATFTTREVASDTDIFNECFEKDTDLRSKVTEENLALIL